VLADSTCNSERGVVVADIPTLTFEQFCEVLLGQLIHWADAEGATNKTTAQQRINTFMVAGFII
jgi:hypothetical protein